MLPVLLAVATATALGFGFLYLTRPTAGDLGAIRVVVSDEAGKAGAIHIVVAEAPLVQTETVTPGPAFAGAVFYPAPYLTKPNLKVTADKRRYEVAAETELGFTWTALPLPDDIVADPKAEANVLDQFLGDSMSMLRARGKLKPGLVFEDFRWEAKGLRAPPSVVPPKPFEQTGKFTTVIGQESMVFFPVPYASPPNVELIGTYGKSVILTECTAKGFKWKNVAKDAFANQGDVTWTAKGVLGPGEGKEPQ